MLANSNNIFFYFKQNSNDNRYTCDGYSWYLTKKYISSNNVIKFTYFIKILNKNGLKSYFIKLVKHVLIHYLGGTDCAIKQIHSNFKREKTN